LEPHKKDKNLSLRGLGLFDLGYKQVHEDFYGGKKGD